MGIEMLLALFGSFGLGGLIAALLVSYLFKSYLPSYFAEKGKNLATKEDIGLITNEIEKVKIDYARNLQEIIHQNNLLVEQIRGNNQLRTAALEKRLQAHQEAFTLWRKLLHSVHEDGIVKIVIECQDWWDKNCLYLTPEARTAFNAAYHNACNYPGYSKAGNPEILDRCWDRIERAGEIIVSGAELPPIEQQESIILSGKEMSNTPQEQIR